MSRNKSYFLQTLSHPTATLIIKYKGKSGCIFSFICFPDEVENLSVCNIVHLLDRTETNIIFIWSGKVMLGEAKPSLNITLPDQINMILGELLSNKCFIIPAYVVCTTSIARSIDRDQEAIYQVAVRPCTSLRIASFIFERGILLRSN